MSNFETGLGVSEKFMFGVAAAVMVLAFVMLSQPMWRGEQMVSEMKTNCDKVGGVMLVTRGLLGGHTYECSPRYDKGVEL